MARHELATSAAEVLIINRPSARDLEVVEKRFHLHPLDLETLFYVPQKSSSQTYGQYIRLTVSWPELVAGRVQIADAVFIVESGALAIISHHPSPVLEAVIGAWKHQMKTDQRSPLELFIDCLSIISRSIESSAAAAAVDPSVVTSLTTALALLPRAAADIHITFSSSLAQRLAMIQHRLKYAGESLATIKRPLQPSTPPARQLGRLARGYALASAGVVLLVIAVIKG